MRNTVKTLSIVLTFLFSVLLVFFLIWKGVLSPLSMARSELILKEAELVEEAAQLHQKLLTMNGTIRDVQFPDELLWNAQQRTQTETQIQRIVLDLAKQVDMQITRVARLIFDDNESPQRVGSDIELEGDLGNLVEFLHFIETTSPRLAVSALSIRSGSFRQENDGETLVNVRVEVWGYWREGE